MGIIVRSQWLRFSILLLILSGYMYMVFGQTYERIFFALSVLILIIGIKKITYSSQINLNLESIAYSVFILVFLIDYCAFLSSVCIVYGGAMFLAYFLAYAVLSKNGSEAIYDMSYKVSFCISLVILVVSVILEKVSLFSYKGIFGNPNTMGIFAATIITFSLAKVFGEYSIIRRLNLIDIGMIVLSFCVVIISSCRTAFVAIVLEFLLVLWLWIRKESKERIPNAIIKVILGGVLLVIILAQTGMLSLIGKTVIDKFVHVKSMTGDITNGRTDLWKIVWNKSSLLGDGTLIYKGELAVHNIYFGLVNQFGKLAGLSYFVFIIIILIKSFKVAVGKIKCRWKFIPILSSILFFCVSLMENYLMTPPMILMYISLPLIRNDNKVFLEHE